MEGNLAIPYHIVLFLSFKYVTNHSASGTLAMCDVVDHNEILPSLSPVLMNRLLGLHRIVLIAARLPPRFPPLLTLLLLILFLNLAL